MRIKDPITKIPVSLTKYYYSGDICYLLYSLQECYCTNQNPLYNDLKQVESYVLLRTIHLYRRNKA